MRQLLRDIAEIGAGQGAPQGDSNYCTDGIPFVKAGNMESLISGGSLNDIQKVSERVARDHKLKLYPKGTVLFAKSGMSCLKGYVYVLPQEAYVVSHLACITPKEDISDYLRFYFDYHRPNQLVKDPAYPSISLADIGALEIDTKDAKSRERIISVLHSIEAILENRKQQLSNLDDLIKAQFVEMFGDPIKNDRGWKQISLLESLAEGRTVSYGIVQTGDDYENGVPVFRPVDIAGGNVPKRSELKKTDPVISEQYRRTILKGNELLVTVRGSVGETFQITDEFNGCNVGRNIVPLLTDSTKVDQRFLQELFAQKAVKRWLQGITKGIALQGLNMGEFKEMPVITPPIEEQKMFVHFAVQVDKSKVVVQKALDEVQILFDSLMQQFFG